MLHHIHLIYYGYLYYARQNQTVNGPKVVFESKKARVDLRPACLSEAYIIRLGRRVLNDAVAEHPTFQQPKILRGLGRAALHMARGDSTWVGFRVIDSDLVDESRIITTAVSDDLTVANDVPYLKICSVRHLPEAAYADLQAGLDEVALAISLQLESVQVDREDRKSVV